MTNNVQSERVDALVALTKANRENVKPSLNNTRFYIGTKTYYVVSREEKATNVPNDTKWLGECGFHVYERK